jgi:hypothetical protein
MRKVKAKSAATSSEIGSSNLAFQFCDVNPLKPASVSSERRAIDHLGRRRSLFGVEGARDFVKSFTVAARGTLPPRVARALFRPNAASREGSFEKPQSSFEESHVRS